MNEYRYVTLDPTGNITALVLSPVEPAAEAAVTRALLKESEQVAYLEPPRRPEAVARVRLMGGEFCGNAAMAAAAWLVRDELEPDGEKRMLLEVSGAEAPVPCTVRRTEDGFEGTVEMPGSPEIVKETLCGISFTAVRMQGITHLIPEDRQLNREETEALLGKIAALLPEEEAIGFLRWDREARQLLPLVFVRGSGSMVWEHGCGSGSAAVGAYEAIRSGNGRLTVSVSQPGGTIRVTAEAENGRIRFASITGSVRFGKESIICH